jgi:hypothetical protein
MVPDQLEPTSRTQPAGATPKLVVTSDELASSDLAETREPVRRPEYRPRAVPPPPGAAPVGLPLWAVVLTCFSALCLPVLCFTATGIRVAVRQRDWRIREAWNRLLCTLLIVSGLLTSLGFVLVLTLWITLAPVTGRTSVSIGPGTLKHSDSFPQFPSASPLNAEQIAAQCKPLVYILAPEPNYTPTQDYLNMAPIGAATMLMADDNGYLFCTSRHVVDEKGLPAMFRKGNRMLIFARDGEYAPVEVVGRNRELDIAVLWEARSGARSGFTQPIARSANIRTGQPVFVIGHPQRLFFTLSSGLVTRVEDPHILQFSAPISPGNSGGPVYDASGNLLGVVQSMVDRERSPNAENLNFAVRAETLLSDAGWEFSGPGSAAMGRLRQNQNKDMPRQDH